MKSYLYAAALAAVVATPAIAAEQLTDNQMDHVTAGNQPSFEVVVNNQGVFITHQGSIDLAMLATLPNQMDHVTAGNQPSFEVVVNNQGVFITHQGSIDLAMLATLPNSAFTVTSNRQHNRVKRTN